MRLPVAAQKPERRNEDGFMLFNRIERCLGPPPGPEYYVVQCAAGTVFVSRETAYAVMKRLQRWLRPRWTRIVDLSGSKILVLTASIHFVGESTAEQRAHDRALRRKIDEEDSGETPVWG
jgi:hypothetical protein